MSRPVSEQDRGGVITIMPIASTDAELVAGILAASEVKPAWAARDIATFIQQPGVHGFVASYDDYPAGVLLYRLILPEAEILTLGVAREFQRRGVAAALMAKLHVKIKAAGGEKVFLEVAVNNKAAEELYKNLGYISISTRNNYYRVGDYFINAEVFCKNLIKKRVKKASH